MYGIASLFFFVLFKGFITPELAAEYLAGAVLLGAAPCTAMVFVWSTLTRGDPAYTVVQVATNDLIILAAFVPIVKFLLGISNVSVPTNTLFLSVILFVVIPLAGGILTRLAVVVAVALFGTTSPAALATTVGVLTEVPVMLTLVKLANQTKKYFR